MILLEKNSKVRVLWRIWLLSRVGWRKMKKALLENPEGLIIGK